MPVVDSLIGELKRRFMSDECCRAEPGLGIGIGIGRFFTKSEKIGKFGFLLPVLLAAGFPTEDFL